MGMAGLAGGSAGLGAIGGITTGILSFIESRKKAEAAKDAALVERDLELRKGRALAGRQTTAFSAGGVKVTTGTPLDILAQTAADAEINAMRASFGLRQQAKDFKSAGTAALIGGILGGGQSILGGLAQ